MTVTIIMTINDVEVVINEVGCSFRKREIWQISKN